jgi:hypothetical protein
MKVRSVKKSHKHEPHIVVPTSREASALDKKHLQYENKLVEERFGMLLNIVPKEFTRDGIQYFRSTLALVSYEPAESLLDQSWRPQEATKDEGMICPGWKGEDKHELLSHSHS